MSVVLEGNFHPSDGSVSGKWRFVSDLKASLNFHYNKTSYFIPKEFSLNFDNHSLDIDMSINNNNNQEASPSTEPNSLVGYYQGNFEIFSKEGISTMPESYVILCDDVSVSPFSIAYPTPPQFSEGIRKIFESNLMDSKNEYDEKGSNNTQQLTETSNKIESLSTLYGFGKNGYGIFSIIGLVNKSSGEFFCEKKYMILKQSHSKRVKVTDSSTFNKVPKLPLDESAIVDFKRRRTESSKLRVYSRDYDGKDDSLHDSHKSGIHLDPDSDDDKSYVEGQYDEDAGEVYEGSTMNGKRHGLGIVLRSDGTLYEGQWIFGSEQGYGKLMTYNRQIIYSGEFLEGQFNGHGEYFFPNGDKYIGEWKEGSRHGRGEYIFKNGCRYIGDWKENKRHGKGTFTWPDGSFYEGEWENDLRHGRGNLELIGKFKYEGMWVNNFAEGRGLSTFSDGQEYQGSFRQGCREGRGSITFPQGAVYEGRFRDDKIDGMGTIKVLNTLPGAEDGEIFIPIQVQADIKRIHLRAGFGDEIR